MAKNDALLIQLTDLAESDKAIETDVTLLVDGLLISGFVISADKYMKHHVIAEAYWKNLNNRGLVANDPTDRPANFIHMRDAKYYLPGANPIPGNTGVFVRISLSSIHAFSFGKLEAE